MSKWKNFLVAMSIVFCFAGSAMAGTILVVSDANAPSVAGGNHEDDELVSFLTGLGHTVDTTGMSQAMRGDWSGNAGITSAVNAADMVIVSRRTSSGSYNNPGLWNGVDKPLLLMSGFLVRNNRWGYHTNDDITGVPTDQNSMAVLNGAHPYADGVGTQLFDWQDASSTPNHVGTNNAPKVIQVGQTSTLVSGANLVGTMNSDRAMLYQIPAGTTVKGTTLTQDRAFFGHWGYDDANADYRFDDFITDNYKQVMENIVNDMVGVTVVPNPPDPSKPVALVLGSGAGPTSGADASAFNFLVERYGENNVKYQQANTLNTATDLDGIDVLVLSSTPGSGDYRGKVNNLDIGIVNWEEAVADSGAGEFGMSNAVMTKSVTTTLMTVVDNAHPIMTNLDGTIEILTVGAESTSSTDVPDSVTVLGVAADGIDTAGITSVVGNAMILVVEAGDEVNPASGSNPAAGRRVMFPMTDNTFNSLTAEGRQLFGQSVDWAAGFTVIPEPGTFGLLAIAGAMMVRRKKVSC